MSLSLFHLVVADWLPSGKRSQAVNPLCYRPAHVHQLRIARPLPASANWLGGGPNLGALPLIGYALCRLAAKRGTLNSTAVEMAPQGNSRYAVPLPAKTGPGADGQGRINRRGIARQ
jgi:hypothetical protein